MSKYFLIQLILNLSIFCAQAQVDSANIYPEQGPYIEFETLIIDLGTITYDSLRKSHVVFYFKNTGNEDLKVSIGRSGGFFDWVVPYYSSEPLKPGQIGTIALKNWLPRYGPFDKSFLVHSNATKSEVSCRVKGNIIRTE